MSGRGRSARMPRSEIPSTSSTSTEEPTTSNSPGMTTDPHPERLQLPGRVEQLIRERPARGDDRAFDPLRADDRLEGRAVTVRSVGAVRTVAVSPMDSLLRPAPDHPRLQTGRFVEAALDPRGRLRVAEDQAALLGRSRPRDPAGERPSGDHAEQQQAPDADRLVAAELPVDDQVARQPDQKRVERRDPEERRHLVERCLVEDVLVAIVEPGELPNDQHQREREQGKGIESVLAEHRDTDQDRDRRRGDIRERQRTAVRGVPAVGRVPQDPLGDRLGSRSGSFRNSGERIPEAQAAHRRRRGWGLGIVRRPVGG